MKIVNLDGQMTAALSTRTKVYLGLSTKALISLDNNTLRMSKCLPTANVITKMIDYREQYLFLISKDTGTIEIMDMDKGLLLMKYQAQKASPRITDIVIDRARDQLVYACDLGVQIIKISLSTGNELSFYETGKESYLDKYQVQSIAIVSHHQLLCGMSDCSNL